MTLDEIEQALLDLRQEQERWKAQRWTINKAAKISGFSMTHIHRLLIADKIKGKKVGRLWYIESRSLLEYVGR